MQPSPVDHGAVNDYLRVAAGEGATHAQMFRETLAFTGYHVDMSLAKTYSATFSKRMEEEIGKTERGQEANAKADKRWVHWTANEIENNEAKEKAKEGSPQIQGVPAAANLSVRRSPR